jgi:hypothetical protein
VEVQYVQKKRAQAGNHQNADVLDANLAAQRKSLTSVPPWFRQKFEFTFPIEQFPTLSPGLRGTPGAEQPLGTRALLNYFDLGFRAA